MDQTKLEQWRQLHVRVARGEVLTEQERRCYEEYLQQLDAQEVIGGDLASLQKLREEVNELGGKREVLEDRRKDLLEKVALLESRRPLHRIRFVKSIAAGRKFCRRFEKEDASCARNFTELKHHLEFRILPQANRRRAGQAA